MKRHRQTSTTPPANYPTPPVLLSTSWICIITLLHIQEVATWSISAPNSVRSRGRREGSVLQLQQPARPSQLQEGTSWSWHQTLSRYLQHSSVSSSSLFMTSADENDSQEDIDDDGNDEGEEELNEDTIMEIANALTSSALPKQSEDGDKDDNINTYLEKASDAWGGAAASSSKGTGIDKPKIDKTKLVGMGARESFLSKGAGSKTPMKGIVSKSVTGPIGDKKSSILTGLKTSTGAVLPPPPSPLAKKTAGDTNVLKQLSVGVGGTFLSKLQTPEGAVGGMGAKSPEKKSLKARFYRG
eukprot:g11447.t1 g11447   contig5:882630-883643(+)